MSNLSCYLKVGAQLLAAGLCLVAVSVVGCKSDDDQQVAPLAGGNKVAPQQQDETPATKPPTPVSSKAVTEVEPKEAEFRFFDPKPDTACEPGKRIGASGLHRLATNDHMWLFLEDVFGGYYLQNPPATLFPNGQWEQNNVVPGKGIRCIIAVRVDEDGHKRVRGWAEVNRWGKILVDEIQSLPGYGELGRVRIITPDPD